MSATPRGCLYYLLIFSGWIAGLAIWGVPTFMLISFIENQTSRDIAGYGGLLLPKLFDSHCPPAI